MTYATNRLYEEVAYVAYYFHWSLDEILELEHPVRHRFVEEIGRINRSLSGGVASYGDTGPAFRRFLRRLRTDDDLCCRRGTSGVTR